MSGRDTRIREVNGYTRSVSFLFTGPFMLGFKEYGLFRHFQKDNGLFEAEKVDYGLFRLDFRI